MSGKSSATAEDLEKTPPGLSPDDLFRLAETAMIAALDIFLWENDRGALLGHIGRISGFLAGQPDGTVRSILARTSPVVDARLPFVPLWKSREDSGRKRREKGENGWPQYPVPFVAFLLAQAGFHFTKEERAALRCGEDFGVEEAAMWHRTVSQGCVQAPGRERSPGERAGGTPEKEED